MSFDESINQYKSNKDKSPTIAKILGDYKEAGYEIPVPGAQAGNDGRYFSGLYSAAIRLSPKDNPNPVSVSGSLNPGGKTDITISLPNNEKIKFELKMINKTPGNPPLVDWEVKCK